MPSKISSVLVVAVFVLASCNLPLPGAAAEGTPTLSVEQVSGTSVALTMAFNLTAMAGSQTATPEPEPAEQATACFPQATATVDANIRSGPSTAYGVVGLLPNGGSARIAGRNNENTWWYIEFPGGAGGYAWIAGSVTTASCLPEVVQVVAAPPLPVVPTSEPEAEEEEEEAPPPAAKPDLVASAMQVWPNPATKGVPIDVQVKVTNQGDAPSGNFSVQWWSSWAVVGCNWSVPSLAPGESRDLQCTYTYSGWSTYTVKEDVDPGGLVDESNEGNNTREMQLQVKSP